MNTALTPRTVRSATAPARARPQPLRVDCGGGSPCPPAARCAGGYAPRVDIDCTRIPLVARMSPEAECCGRPGRALALTIRARHRAFDPQDPWIGVPKSGDPRIRTLRRRPVQTYRG